VKRVLTRVFVVIVILLQLGNGPGLHPDDPFQKYEEDAEVMGYGAGVGAAFYLVTKILGATIGDSDFAVSLREGAPFMSALIPPKGWLGWKEELLDIAGYATLGAGVASFGAGGEFAQQFQFGMTDAFSHFFIATVAELARGDDFTSTQPPFIDLVMVKTASQIIRDQLIPADIPPFRGRTSEILILNSLTELTAHAAIGAIEGAAIAVLQTKVRKRDISLKEALKQEMVVGAVARGLHQIYRIVYFGPRIHVSRSEKRKIEAYAAAQGIDIRWGLKHAQFRNIKYSRIKKGSGNENYSSGVSDRHASMLDGFDPRNNPDHVRIAAHEAYHLHQMAASPDWIYLRIVDSDFRREQINGEYEKRPVEIFPLDRLYPGGK